MVPLFLNLRWLLMVIIKYFFLDNLNLILKKRVSRDSIKSRLNGLEYFKSVNYINKHLTTKILKATYPKQIFFHLVTYLIIYS